jgi:membrane fusion protein (multidrug efflux system)
VEQAELDLKHTHVMAEKAGWIVNLTLVPGTSVVAYMPLFALVARGSFWVDANFKETELPGIQPGQQAEVEIDMLPGHTYHGVVEVIENGTGAALSLLPAQNATGNWVKVTQRIPVRIRFVGDDAKLPFRVGASAKITVHVRP